MTIGERLKLIIDQSLRSQKEFADLLGLAASTLNQYVNSRRKIPVEILINVCRKFYISITWLTTGQGPMYLSPENAVDFDNKLNDFSLHPEHYLPPEDLALVPGDELILPLVRDIAAGRPVEAAEPEEHVRVSRTLLWLPPPYFAFRVTGTSMQPEVVPGDFVIVSANWSELDLNNRICAFRTCDGILLKRLLLDHAAQTGYLLSINTKHQPIPYGPDSTDLTLIGVLILVLRQYGR